MNKRQFLKTGLLMGAGAVVAPSIFRNTVSAARTADYSAASSLSGEFLQVTLPYAYSALEPHIDAQTMEIHYPLLMFGTQPIL